MAQISKDDIKLIRDLTSQVQHLTDEFVSYAPERAEMTALADRGYRLAQRLEEEAAVAAERKAQYMVHGPERMVELRSPLGTAGEMPFHDVLLLAAQILRFDRSEAERLGATQTPHGRGMALRSDAAATLLEEHGVADHAQRKGQDANGVQIIRRIG